MAEHVCTLRISNAVGEKPALQLDEDEPSNPNPIPIPQVPNLPWHEVINELDYPGFYIPSPEGLSLIMTAYNMCCKDNFPMGLVFLLWVNKKGQVSRGPILMYVVLEWG